MQYKPLFASAILFLVFSSVYIVPATAFFVTSTKFDTWTTAANSTYSENLSHDKLTMNQDQCLYGQNGNCEKTYEWSDFVNADDDSVELVLGINNVDFGTRKQIENIGKKYDGIIVNEIWMGNDLQAVVMNLPLASASLFVEEMQNSGLIRYVEPNIKFQSHFVPNDPYWNLQWGPRKIAADLAWNTTIGDNSLLVAVIDTGISQNHSDLISNYVPLGYDWVNNDTDPTDDNGHGTHCAGIIAAKINNNIGIAGMAQIRIMSEKALDSSGSGDEDDLANAIIHAAQQNASIISMSWGSSYESTLIHEAIRFAYDQGVLLVASAGNNGNDIKTYPAAYDEVISVSATKQDDGRASFSSFGDWVELAAPGVQIYSTVLNNNYGYKDGTSMACPHVAGVAALVWSEFPNMTRDQVRYQLRYTADDLGDAGFDEYYGYGRINVARAINELLPEHDLLIEGVESPPYVELDETGLFNATVLNYGAEDEENITAWLSANGTHISAYTIDSLTSGGVAYANLTWTPTIEGIYNITIEILPATNETIVENNCFAVYTYGGTPLKAFVVHSSGNFWTWITATWEKLNKQWFEFGNRSIFIDSKSLDNEEITYEELVDIGADVLIISAANSAAFGWEFTDSEIEAITQFVYDGHGLIVTADTFSFPVPNNNKLARLVGIDETLSWGTAITYSVAISEPEHPLFNGIPNPYNLSFGKASTIPPGNWTENVVVGGEYVARGPLNESSIVTYRGLVYSSFGIESYASQTDLQLFYNAITWTHYEKPEHDLAAELEAPPYLLPGYSTTLNATVSNIGTSNETDLELQLLINDNVTYSTTIPLLPSNSSQTINYLWAPEEKTAYNVTFCVAPAVNESNLLNNRITRFVTVSDPIIRPAEGQWANYTLHTFTHDTSTTEQVNFTYNHYLSPYKINVTYDHSSLDSKWTTSSIVNVMNRQVEQGTYMTLWFPGWIETNVTLDSNVKIFNRIGAVVGSRQISINNRSVECWDVFVRFPYENYTLYYDKYTGLLMGYDRISIFYQESLTLTSTNIVVGAIIHPKAGDYAYYQIVYYGNDSVTATGTMNFSYLEFLDISRFRVQISCLLFDAEEQIIENFTEYIIVNVQTRMVEAGPPGWNGTYYFDMVETDIGLASQVNIWNQTGTVLGTSEYTVGQRVFYTWIMSAINETQLCLYQHDRTSGLLVKSTTNYLNETSQNMTFTLLHTNVDVSKPFVIITSPENNTATASADVFIFWQGEDSETGLSYYLVYVDTDLVANITSLYPNMVYSLTELSEGNHAVRVEAYDFAGNMNSDEIDIVIDLTAPTASITAPNDGSYLNQFIVFINVTGSDALSFDRMELYINGVLTRTFLSEGQQSYIWNTGAYWHDVGIALVVYDRANHMSTDHIEVTLDTVNPVVQIVQLADYVRGTSNVTVYAYDDNLENVTLYVNDVATDTWTAAGTHVSVWDTTASLDGNVTVRAKAFDKAGNSMEQSVEVVVDNTPPAAEITSPANNAYVSGTVRVNLTADDQNLESATLMLDGEDIADVTGSTYYQLDTLYVLDGRHILMLEAVDKAGNVERSIVTVVIDNTNPTTLITSPKNDAAISGNITITFLTLDVNLKNATIVLGETIFNVTGTSVLTFDTKTLSDGEYTVRLIAFDAAENQNEVEIAVIVDNTSPTVAITAPVDNAQLQGIVNVNFTVNDNHLVSALLYVDEEVFNITTMTSFQWNTSKLGDGLHIMRIVAVDSAGNTNEVQNQVWTTNVQKATEDSYAAGRNLGILLGLIFGIVAGFVALRARKRSRLVNIQKTVESEFKTLFISVGMFHKVFMTPPTKLSWERRDVHW
jgi:thermitase